MRLAYFMHNTRHYYYFFLFGAKGLPLEEGCFLRLYPERPNKLGVLTFSAPKWRENFLNAPGKFLSASVKVRKIGWNAKEFTWGTNKIYPGLPNSSARPWIEGYCEGSKCSNKMINCHSLRRTN